MKYIYIHIYIYIDIEIVVLHGQKKDLKGFESIKVGVRVVGSVFLSNWIALSSNCGIQPQKIEKERKRKENKRQGDISYWRIGPPSPLHTPNSPPPVVDHHLPCLPFSLN